MSAKAELMLVEFDSPGALLHAAERMRDAGYDQFDCHSPFPIHGMDDAMGLGRSHIGWFVGAAAITAFIGINVFIYWVSVVAYPIVVSGKELMSWPAFIPPIFAVTVLTSALTNLVAMLGLNRLPTLYHPIFYSAKIAKITDDGFVVSVPSNDKKYDRKKTEDFLKSLGGKNVEVVTEP